MLATSARRALGGELELAPAPSQEALAKEWQWRIEIVLRMPEQNRVLTADHYVFLMRRENYKVIIEYGTSSQTLHTSAAVLDTGAGPNCIREDAVPEDAVALIRDEPNYRVFDANGNPLSLRGVVTLRVRAGSRLVKTDFIVCQTLQVAVILGIEFLDLQVEQIRPIDQNVTYRDGTVIPIHRRWPQIDAKSRPKVP